MGTAKPCLRLSINWMGVVDGSCGERLCRESGSSCRFLLPVSTLCLAPLPPSSLLTGSRFWKQVPACCCCCSPPPCQAHCPPQGPAGAVPLPADTGSGVALEQLLTCSCLALEGVAAAMFWFLLPGCSCGFLCTCVKTSLMARLVQC